MNYNMPYNPMYVENEGFEADYANDAFMTALGLIKESVQSEREDELFYDWLIAHAKTQEQKTIITSIRNDERNHRLWFREIYKTYTGQDIESKDGEFKKPQSFEEGVRRAFFGELAAMEKYRIIREGMIGRHYRDLVFRILTDEMKHAMKYNYILIGR